MATEEEKQFIALRAKFATELEEVWKQLEDIDEQTRQLEARRDKLENMLQGYDLEEEDEVEEAPTTKPLDLDQAVVQFLTVNPGSMRKQIMEGLEKQGYTRYAVDKSLRRIKVRGLATNRGKTRQTQWYAVQ
jgi:5'-deoxynucleotidase YfbR-like HD superfamily hydrolase